MKKMFSFLIATLALFGVMVGSAMAAGATPGTTVDALLLTIDFDTVMKAILGVMTAGLVYILAKGGAVQVINFVRRLLGA